MGTNRAKRNRTTVLVACAALCALVSGSALAAGGGGGGGGGGNGTGGGKGDGKKATAAPAKKPAPAPVNTGSSANPQAMFSLTPELSQKLASSDESQIRNALDDVRLAGKAAAPAVPAIVKLLQRGVSAGLAETACDTLGDIQSQDATVAIAPYARHRDVKVRRAAAKALARTRGAEAIKALRVSLSDSDAVVRGLAATGLGSLKAKEAVPDLLDALDHKIAESASSVGQLCSPEECEIFMGKLGRLPFDVMTGGFDQMIFRPETELNDDNKVKIIGRLRELGTAEANKFLKDVQGRWPAKWSKRVKQAIDQGVIATGGGS